MAELAADPNIGGRLLLLRQNVNHDLLFPRCHCVVFHGGMGTTAAVLRSGVPGIICSFFADQPYWSNKLYTLGASPTDKLRYGKMSGKQLVSAIQEVNASE